MAKYKFRLATLLRLRENTRDERRAELAEAYRADNLLKERIGNIDSEMDALKSRQQATAAPGAVNVDLLVESQRYEISLRAEKTHFQQQRKTIAEEIDRRQQRLIEANREVRVLEKLRETQENRHREEEERQEAKVLDEAAVQKAVREAVR